MARGGGRRGRKGGGGEGDFEAQHPRGSDGRFVRKQKLQRAAASRRGGQAPQTSGGTYSLRRSTGIGNRAGHPARDKYQLARRIKGLDGAEQTKMAKRFKNEGYTDALESEVGRRLHKAEQRRPRSAPQQSAEPRRTSRTSTGKSFTQKMIDRKQRVGREHEEMRVRKEQSRQRNKRIRKMEEFGVPAVRSTPPAQSASDMMGYAMKRPVSGADVPKGTRKRNFAERTGRIGDKATRTKITRRFVDEGMTPEVRTKMQEAEARGMNKTRRAERRREVGEIGGRVTRPASDGGHYNYMRRRPITNLDEHGNPVSPKQRTRNFIERTAQIREPRRRQAIIDEYTKRGVSTRAKKLLAEEESSLQTTKSAARRARNRERAAAEAAGGTTPGVVSVGRSRARRTRRLDEAQKAERMRQMVQDEEPKNVRRLRGMIESSQYTPGRSAADYTASSIGTGRRLPGYGDARSLRDVGINKTTAKRRLADRIHHLGDEDLKGKVVRKFQRRGIDDVRTYQTLRAAEAKRGRRIGARTAAQENEERQRRVARLQQRERESAPHRAALRETIKGSGLKTIAESVTAQNYEALNKLFSRISPQELDDTVKSGLPDANAKRRLSYRLHDIGNGGVQLTWSLSGHRVIDTYVRDLKIDRDGNASVYHNYLKLRDEHRSGGHGKKIFRTLLPMYEKIGVDQVKVTAALEGGGYTWHRYGFEMRSPNEQQRYARKLTGGVNEISNSSRYNMTSGQKKLMQKTVERLNAGNNRAMITFTDDKTPMTDPRDGKPWYADTHGRPTKDKPAKGNPIPYTPARYMLLGDTFHGEINLKNRMQRNRMFTYVGLPEV